MVNKNLWRDLVDSVSLYVPYISGYSLDELRNMGEHVGPIFQRFRGRSKLDDIPTEWIIRSRNVEVYFAPAIGSLTDPIFKMVTNDGVYVEFAYTGDILKMRRLSSNDSKLETVLEMDPQHRFTLFRDALPADGVKDRLNLAGEQLLEQLIEYAFRKASSVYQSYPNNELAQDFKVLTYDKVVSRFKLMQTLSSTDIIPDQSPRTIFLKAGDGCGMPCIYCPERNASFRAYTIEGFKEEAIMMRKALTDILGPGIERMNELFFNISDFVRLDFEFQKGRTDLNTTTALSIARELFPWAYKRGSFVSTKSALEISLDPNGSEELEGGVYSFEYFRRLADKGNGINRLYLGLETAHSAGSKLLGKPTTYEQSKLAARLIQGANRENIPLKVIVQIGVLGKGFYDSAGEFISWQTATDTTNRWIREVVPYRVLESVYQPYKGLPIIKAIERGKIVPYDSPEHIEIERSRLREGLHTVNSHRRDFRIDDRYEAFLPSNKTSRGNEKLVTMT